MNDFKNLAEAAASIQQPRHPPRPTDWTNAAEDALVMTAEAHRRFLTMSQDPRLATSLTVAWAMTFAGLVSGRD